MALEKTEAILLKKYNWSESSRTAVFFSRKYGRLALIDKGGRSFKTKRGRLMPFARMEITFYKSEKESSGYISDIELIQAFSFEKDGTLGRLAYGSAGCELMIALLPEEAVQESLYTYFAEYLKWIDEADKSFLPSLFITFFLRTMSNLGYHPNLGHCVNCSRPIEVNGNTVAKDFFLSPQRGGMICDTCQMPGDYYIHLSSDSLRLLRALQSASLAEAASLPIGFSQAGILVESLEQLISYPTDLKARFKSLEFLEKLKNSKSFL